MKNFTKAFLISSLMSGSFMTQAMDSWHSEEDKALAGALGMEHPSDFYEFKRGQEDRIKSIEVDVDSFSPNALKEQQEVLNSFNTSPMPGRKSNSIHDDARRNDEEMASLFGMGLPQYLKWKKEEEEEMASLKLINDLKSQEEVDRRERRLREEEETNRFIRQIEEEERNAALARQLAQKEEDAELARRLNDEELARQFEAQAVISPHPFIPYEAPLKEQIAHKTWEYAKGENRPTLQKFMEIFEYLKTIPQGSDVHILDNYVFGAPKTITALLNVGRLYDIDDGNLTLAQVGQQMVQFANDNKDFFATYKYEGNALNGDQIITILNSHFPNMDNEIRSISLEARELWSRAWTLALNLYKEGDETAIQIIFDQAVEGHLTRGGCIQGRIDRGFVGYVSLLARAGVNLY